MTGSSLPSRAACGEVARVFLQRVVAVLGRGGVGGAALADLVDRLVERLRRDAGRRRGSSDVVASFSMASASSSRSTVTKESPAFSASCSAVSKTFASRRREVELARAARHLRHALASAASVASSASLRVAAGALDQAGRQPFVVVEQHLQKMFGRELLVALARAPGLRGLDEAARPLGVFLEIHIDVSTPSAGPLAARSGKLTEPLVRSRVQITTDMGTRADFASRRI